MSGFGFNAQMIAFAVSSAERSLNAFLEGSTAARAQLASIDGASLGVHLTGPEIELIVRASGRRLEIAKGSAAQGDAVLSGTPLGLLSIWRSGRTADFESSGAHLSGDAQTLEAFVRLFELLLPDAEELVARVTGDVAAHELVRALHALESWTTRAIDALLLSTAEFLQEESRDLPAPAEMEGFTLDVERLRDDVARAAARVDRIAASARRMDGPEAS